MEYSDQNNTGLNSMADNSINNAVLSTKDNMIKNLDFLLENYANLDFNKELARLVKQWRRKRREFDSTRFFVLVVGPVKSGKSTLVNIFARKYVSPTAYKECTALPTIIGKSNGMHLNKIIQYFPTEQFNTDEAKRETFDYIVDVIREVENYDVLKDRVRTASSELTKDKIEDIITLYHDEEVDKEELVVSIGIEGGGFIDDEIMLIGLDGSKIHKDNILVYSNMAKRADVVFFVQSTNSAINKTSIDFLNELFHEKKGKVPVWLIHNFHDSQYFLSDDLNKSDNIKEQIAIGRKRIKEGFEIDRFDDITLNLGKIYAAINAPDRVKPENYEEIEKAFEEYKKIENELIETLKKERQEIKDNANIGKAMDTISESIKIVEKVINETRSRKQDICDKIGKMNSLSAMLDSVQISDSSFLEEYDNLSRQEQIRDSWETRISLIVDQARPKCGDYIKGEDLKKKIERITDESSNAIPVGVGTQFRNQLINSLCASISKSLQSCLDEIRQIITEITQEKIIDLIWEFDTQGIKIKSSPFETSYLDIMEKKYKIWKYRFWNKKYSFSDQNEYLDKIKDLLIKNIPVKLQDYRNILKSDFIIIRDKYVNKLKSQIDKYAENYANKQKTIIETLDKEIEVMNVLQKDLRKI